MLVIYFVFLKVPLEFLRTCSISTLQTRLSAHLAPTTPRPLSYRRSKSPQLATEVTKPEVAVKPEVATKEVADVAKSITGNYTFISLFHFLNKKG